MAVAVLMSERNSPERISPEQISDLAIPDSSPLRSSESAALRRYNRLLLAVAGLGGLLYGIDVGIIGGALPYLEASSKFTAQQLSGVVAAVLLGSVFSTLISGLLADWMGRRPLMVLSGCAFVASVPVIALSHGLAQLLAGRLLQGISAGIVGVVVPLYLAECLTASARGRGTAIFQWLLTLGFVLAALVGVYYSYRIGGLARNGDAALLFAFKNQAWRRIFWISMAPGGVFVLGSLMVTESPRWLFRRGAHLRAQEALLRSRTPRQAALELEEMAAVAPIAEAGHRRKIQDPLLRRKYVIPFLLACVILFCNTATGVNSIIGYNTGILLQSGLSDLGAHWGYVFFTIVNFLATTIGMTLVDRRGRRFLLILGASGVIVSLAGVGLLFRTTERQAVNARAAVQALAGPGQELQLSFTPGEAQKLLKAAGYAGSAIRADRASLAIIYSYGDFTAATDYARSDEAAASIDITRANCVPANRVEAFFQNPFGDLHAAESAPLRIEKANIGTIPDAAHGWLVALGLYVFMSFFALGPGVVVWLALSELMPTRIRSNGMSIALVINQLVSTTLAGIFLPFVSRHGYAAMFFLFASFTAVYLVTAIFFLPETKEKTLEEIEAYFERRGAAGSASAEIP